MKKYFISYFIIYVYIYTLLYLYFYVDTFDIKVSYIEQVFYSLIFLFFI